MATIVAIQATAEWARRRPPGPRRRLEVQAAFSCLLCAYLVCTWALSGAEYFWPIFVAVGLALALGAHVVFLDLRGFDLRAPRERELTERVDVLTRTRRDALDVQDAELRRIERDLHDGAQARLVALSMKLGRAEAGLADSPEAAELVRQARAESGAAIAELRDLSRGIAPPILVDRGLVAAVESLGRRSAIPVAVDGDGIARRPPASLETAAYFVVAESLTNVAKHAPEAEATVAIRLDEERLTVEVADTGPGGADPEGGGLRGLRQRVAALDGTLLLESPAGGGTTITAEIPCGS
jgi:signal transduction histidine kinase